MNIWIFDDRIISRNMPVNWAPRSSVFMPLNNLLGPSAKLMVYKDKPATAEHVSMFYFK